MTNQNPQPEWLRPQTCGLEGGSKWSVLIEGRDFAVVKEPGGDYWSGRGMRSYGPVAYILCAKHGTSANELLPSVLRAPELQRGGRVSKAKLAEWRKLVEACDAKGELVKP